jgi:hypothetical protein
MGFMAGWLPSLLVGAIVGLVWPLLVLGGAVTGAVLGLQYVDLSPAQQPQASVIADRFLAFRKAVCDLPPSITPTGNLHLIPPEQLTKEQKAEVRQYLLGIARDRRVADSVRKACDATPAYSIGSE